MVEAIIRYAVHHQVIPQLLEWASENVPLATFDRHQSYELSEVIKNMEPTVGILLREWTPESETAPDSDDDFIWEMASLKSELHALSEAVASEAFDQVYQVPLQKTNSLHLLIPLLFFLRWKSGYRASVEHILELDSVQLSLAGFNLTEARPSCPIKEGVLSAELTNDQQIVIKLGNHPLAVLEPRGAAEIPMVINSVSSFGTLQLDDSDAEDVSLREQLSVIPIYPHLADADELTLALIRNRKVLFPLLARLGIPGSDWILTEGATQSEIGKSIPKNRPSEINRKINRELELIDRQEEIESVSFGLQGKFRQLDRDYPRAPDLEALFRLVLRLLEETAENSRESDVE